jgi:hypothetical protein
MDVPAPPLPCFLAEWYPPESTAEPIEQTMARLVDAAAAMTTEGSPVRMHMAIAVPTDEVVFGVFSAGSARLVVETSQRAGLPARRVTAAMGSWGPVLTSRAGGTSPVRGNTKSP